MKIKFEPFFKKSPYYHMVVSWFNNPEFYYDTHIPVYIKLEEINEYLSCPSASLLLIFKEEQPIGLCDAIFFYAPVRVEIEIEFITKKLWEEVGEMVIKDYFKYLFQNFPIIKIEKYVYSFDEITCRTLEKAKMTPYNIYPKSVYKNGEWYDHYKYCIFREEFFSEETK